LKPRRLAARFNLAPGFRFSFAALNRLLDRGCLADQLCQLRRAEDDVALPVEQEPVAVELERQRGIEGVSYRTSLTVNLKEEYMNSFPNPRSVDREND